MMPFGSECLKQWTYKSTTLLYVDNIAMPFWNNHGQYINKVQ